MKAHQKKRLKQYAPAALVAVFVLGLVLALPRVLNPEQPVIVNAHESVEGVAEIVKLQNTMEILGIERTVLHGIPKDLLYFEGEGIDLAGAEENNAAIVKAVAEYPDQFSYFCTLDPNDPLRLNELEDCVEDGAIGVKLYNGYSYAHITPIDDAKLNEFYAAVQGKGLILMLPVNTEAYEAELRNVLTLQPELKLICSHFCLSSKNLDRLTALMTDFPNLYIDTSFGNIEFALEGFQTLSENREEYRTFFESFQDRILFATDAVVTSYEDKTVEWLNALYGDYVSIFTENTFTLQSDSSVTLEGLDLSRSIQEKIFNQNWSSLTK